MGLNGTSTTAGCHRTKADAARAVDALLLHHGRPAVNFPGEEEATRAAFPDIGERRVRQPAGAPKPRPRLKAPRAARNRRRSDGRRATPGRSSATRRGSCTIRLATDVGVGGATRRFDHATELEAAISYDAVRMCHRGEARLNFPTRAVARRRLGLRGRRARMRTPRRRRRPGALSTTAASWAASTTAREGRRRVYDFARRCRGQPVVCGGERR